MSSFIFIAKFDLVNQGNIIICEEGMIQTLQRVMVKVAIVQSFCFVWHKIVTRTYLSFALSWVVYG